MKNETMPRTAADSLPGNPPAKLAGRYRTADGQAMIEWEVETKENGPEFSASGEYDGGGGQNIDTIATAYPNDPAVQRIAAVWREWHLNGMNAGTPEQVACLRAAEALIPNAGRGDYFGWACGVLKNAGLYEIVLPDGITATGGFPWDIATRAKLAALREAIAPLDAALARCGKPAMTDAALLAKEGLRGYRYGERWLYRPIPQSVLDEIASWADFARKDSRSLGDCKASEFLARNQIKCRIALSNTKPANWEPSGDHYRVTLSGRSRRLVFDFWGSANDASEGRAPTVYSVLSCVASDIHTPETFEDFCSEYGEDQDSRKALQTFRRADKFAARLRAFFDETERKELEAIR